MFNDSLFLLYDSYKLLRQEIAENTDADLILYFSTQWLSVIGYLFQADPSPEWVHVDQNWYDYGSIPYKFKMDTDFAEVYSEQVKIFKGEDYNALLSCG